MDIGEIFTDNLAYNPYLLQELYPIELLYFRLREVSEREDILVGRVDIVHEKIRVERRYLCSADSVSFESGHIDEPTRTVPGGITKK